MKKKPNPPPGKPGPYIGKLFRSQESKAANNSKASPARENTLVDLVSSWDSSAQTAPGIQSFIKDESQILKPVKPGEEAEEEKTVEVDSIPEDLYSVPVRRAEKRKPDGAGVRQFSVEHLSQIFEEKAAASSQDSSPVHAVSGGGVRTAAVARWSKSPPKTPTKSPPNSPIKSPPKSPTKSPPKSPEPKPLPPLPTKETPATGPVSVPVDADYDYPPEEEFLYQALYNYTAADATELTIREGDMVISVAGFTPDMSPGWLMVRQEGELDEGWVPESYLKKMGPVYEPEPVSGRGQVSSPLNPTPICECN